MCSGVEFGGQPTVFEFPTDVCHPVYKAPLEADSGNLVTGQTVWG